MWSSKSPLPPTGSPCPKLWSCWAAVPGFSGHPGMCGADEHWDDALPQAEVSPCNRRAVGWVSQGRVWGEAGGAVQPRGKGRLHAFDLQHVGNMLEMSWVMQM